MSYEGSMLDLVNYKYFGRNAGRVEQPATVGWSDTDQVTLIFSPQ